MSEVEPPAFQVTSTQRGLVMPILSILSSRFSTPNNDQWRDKVTLFGAGRKVLEGVAGFVLVLLGLEDLVDFVDDLH